MARGQGRSLQSRARDREGGATPARVPEGKTMLDQIRDMEPEFRKAMPTGGDAVQLIRDALTCVRLNPKLAECTPASVLGALMTCAQLNLRVGVLGQAWPVPFWDNKSRTNQAQLVIGYKGYIALGYRSDRLDSIVARTVLEGDEFTIEYGLSDTLVHKPQTGSTKDKPAVGYYAVARFRPSGHVFFYMSHADMEDYRDKYATFRDSGGRIRGPWVDQFEAMAHKTCVRQMVAWIPQSAELMRAADVDGTVRVDLNPEADPDTVSHHYDNGNVVKGEATETPAGDGEAETSGSGQDEDGRSGPPDPDPDAWTEPVATPPDKS